MALNATMYRFGINLSDMDRGYYDQRSLHVALHPSETTERLVIRLLAWCLHAHPDLRFTKGLSTEDEPDLWQFSDTQEIALWLEVGLPESKRLRRAAGRAAQVGVYAYGGQALQQWLQQNHKEFLRLDNLFIRQFDPAAVYRLMGSLERTMELSCMIQDQTLMLSWDEHMLEIAVKHWYPESAG